MSSEKKNQGSIEPIAAGNLRVHPAGYGFVVREDGHEDVFIPAKYRGVSLDGDRVQVYTWPSAKGTEGRVDEVLKRGRSRITGVIEKRGAHMVLVPDDPRIQIDFSRVTLEGDGIPTKDGECVVADITVYPNAVRKEMVVRVTSILGPPDDPETEIRKIIINGNLPTDFIEQALEQAKETPQTVGQQELDNRLDLRDKVFLTIDPKTARDFDDALCIEASPKGGTRVWIAVADVSNYVQPGDALDTEAISRGVSVYLPDRVIPMLPMELSSGICSLNPNVERCAMVVCLDFDKSSNLVETDFAAAVICSKGRLDYPGVASALRGDFTGRLESYEQWLPKLEALNALAKKLRKRRRARGTLELEIAEPKIVLDADDPRLVRDVVRSKGVEGVRDAYELVEEFMVAANEAVGRFFASRDLPTVWRIHAPPKDERLEELSEKLEGFDIEVDIFKAQTPVGMRDVLKDIESQPAAQALSFLVLRSLSQAAYDTVNVGHFGLASTEYIHFTSPIRRYPDLLVHRLMKQALRKENKPSGNPLAKPVSTKEGLQDLAKQCSEHERRAVDVEREAVAMYRAYIMRDRVGEEFEGVISGVTHFGVFVELDDPFVEGLIKIDALGDDYYNFDEVTMRLAGRRTGHTVSLGDRVVVEVIHASIAMRRVEMRLSSGGEMLEPSGQSGRRGKEGRNRSQQGKKPKDSRGKRRGTPSKGAPRKGRPTKKKAKTKSATSKKKRR